jgi:cytochrome P450
MVFISSIRIQRDPDIYEDPMEFRPERFLTLPKGTDSVGTTYFPFGSGHHICIAQNLAKTTVKMILLRLLQNFDLKLASDEVKEIKFLKKNFLLTPAQQIHIEFTKRTRNTKN